MHCEKLLYFLLCACRFYLCFPIVRFAILAEDIHVSHNIDVGFAVLAEAAQEA